MKQPYKLLLTLALGLLITQQAWSQTNFTLQLDMSAVQPESAPQGYGNIEATPAAENGWGQISGVFSNIGNHVYQVTIASSLNTGATFDVGFRYNNGVTTIFNDIPTSCSAGSPRGYEAYSGVIPAEGATIRYRWNGCQVSTFAASAWDVTPTIGSYLMISDNLTTSSDYQTTGVGVAPGKTLTVGSGKTLEISGQLKGQSPYNIQENFEVPAQITDEFIVSGNDANMAANFAAASSIVDNDGDKAFQVNLPAGTGFTGGDIWILRTKDFLLKQGSTYTVKINARSTDHTHVAGTGRLFLQSYLAGNGSFLQIGFNTLKPTWQEFTLSFTVPDALAHWVAIYVKSDVAQTIYIDDFSIIETGVSTTPGSVAVNSGGSLITYDADANTTPVTIHRNKRFAGDQYSFVGSPVASPALAGADLGAHVYSYDETVAYGADGLARWMDASSSPLMVGNGYAAAGGFQNLTFTGVPNTGDVVLPNLTHTAPDANHDEHGWQLVANPYAAAISVETFLAKNSTTDQMITNAVYLWDDHGSNTGRGDNGDYLMASTLGTVAGPNGGSFNGYIGSAQGFFVKVSSPRTDATVTFSEDMRSSGNNADANFFRKADAKDTRIKLALSTESGLYNETLIGFREDATVGIDYQYDADKLIGNNNLQFYSLINDSRFGIQGLPLVDGVSTELAFNLGLAENLTLSIVDMNIADAGKTFFLYDAVTKETYNLSEVNSFTFSGVAGSDQNRFTLTYAAANVLSNSLGSSQPIYRYTDGHLNVKFGRVLTVAEYTVYDLSGKVIKQHSLANATTETLNIDIQAKGINIVKIATSEGVFTRKFIF